MVGFRHFVAVKYREGVITLSHVKRGFPFRFDDCAISFGERDHFFEYARVEIVRRFLDGGTCR